MGRHVFEVLAKLVHRILPGIAFVPDVAMKHTKRDEVGFSATILNGPDNPRCALKTCLLCEVAADFQVWIDAILDRPKRLEDIEVPIDDRCVVSLAAMDRDRQLLEHDKIDIALLPDGRSFDLAVVELSRSPQQNAPEQTPSAGRYGEGIAEYPCLRMLEPGKARRLRRHQELIDLIHRHERQPQRKSFCEPLARLHANQQE